VIPKPREPMGSDNLCFSVGHGYGASASSGMPVYSQLSLVLFNKPQRDAPLSWRGAQ